jgi:hypothetical protein
MCHRGGRFPASSGIVVRRAAPNHLARRLAPRSEYQVAFKQTFWFVVTPGDRRQARRRTFAILSRSLRTPSGHLFGYVPKAVPPSHGKLGQRLSVLNRIV